MLRACSLLVRAAVVGDESGEEGVSGARVRGADRSIPVAFSGSWFVERCSARAVGVFPCFETEALVLWERDIWR